MLVFLLTISPRYSDSILHAAGSSQMGTAVYVSVYYLPGSGPVPAWHFLRPGPGICWNKALVFQKIISHAAVAQRLRSTGLCDVTSPEAVTFKSCTAYQYVTRDETNGLLDFLTSRLLKHDSSTIKKLSLPRIWDICKAGAGGPLLMSYPYNTDTSLSCHLSLLTVK